MRLALTKQTPEILLADLSDQTVRYLVARSDENRIRLISSGKFDIDPDGESMGIAQRIREQLQQQSISCSRACLLLSRPEIDTFTDSLPPVSDSELPVLVANLVAQNSEDADSKVIDFLVTSHANENGVDVLAMTCDQSAISEHVQEFNRNGFDLQHITYSGLGAVQLLGQVAHQKQPIAAAITFTDQTTKIAVLHHGLPLLFRSLQVGMEPTKAYGTALAAELQRTLAFVGVADEDSAQVYLIGEKSELIEVASVLAETISSSVSIADACDQIDVSELDSFDDAPSYANLIGIASAISSKSLNLDFLNPREIPKPPSGMKRIAFWGAVASSVLFLLGFMWYSDNQEQKQAIETKKSSLQRFSKRANKSLEYQDIVDAVHQWQKSDIAWLDEIQDLTQRFPMQSESLVKRMTMSTGNDGYGVVDLSVQVSSPDVVTALEAAIRDDRHSVTSKRVAEVSDSENLNWSFETRIIFRPTERLPFALEEPLATDSPTQESEQ